jgi:hypothetical protein
MITLLTCKRRLGRRHYKGFLIRTPSWLSHCVTASSMHIIALSLPVFVLTRFALARCRSRPGDINFPSASDWKYLQEQVDGRLLQVVPSAQACEGCHLEQWTSSSFRSSIVGQMMNASPHG